jgi:hypothetical protein
MRNEGTMIMASSMGYATNTENNATPLGEEKFARLKVTDMI